MTKAGQVVGVSSPAVPHCLLNGRSNRLVSTADSSQCTRNLVKQTHHPGCNGRNTSVFGSSNSTTHELSLALRRNGHSKYLVCVLHDDGSLARIRFHSLCNAIGDEASKSNSCFQIDEILRSKFVLNEVRDAAGQATMGSCQKTNNSNRKL